MSLKYFHLIFIFSANILFIMTDIWFYLNEEILFLTLSLVGTVILFFYLKKIFSFLFLSIFSLFLPSHPLSACAVCFGNSDNLAIKGLSSGILTMLGIVVFLWIAFLLLFIHLYKKSHNQKISTS